VGSRADLLLVEDDPLTDVGTLACPLGVMVRGEWLGQERLETLAKAPEGE
jgi:hypothetical protein